MTITTTNMKIGFIGAGNMAFSLIGGLIKNGYESKNIWISDTDSEKLTSMASNFSINLCENNESLADLVDVVVFAVKPQVLRAVCEQIASSNSSSEPLYISIAAGIKSKTIAKWLYNSQPSASIIRCMPNTPSLVQSGATALYAMEQVSKDQKMMAESIMRAVGLTVWVNDEEHMHAVTAISGSGPAYYFNFIEIMEQSAIKMGLDKKTARLLAVETAFGAAKMALESNDDPKTLKDKVTSPGGTTEKALEIMQQGGIEKLLFDAVIGAQKRSEELSTLFDQ